MNKRFIAVTFILMFLGLTALVLAQEDVDEGEKEEPERFLDIGEKKTEFGAIKGTLNDETVNILEKEINFPVPLQFFTKLIFGLGWNEPITIEKLALLSGIWILIFAMIFATIGFLPMFDDKKIQIGVSVIVMILIGMTGTINNLTTSYFQYLATLKLLENSSPLRLILGIIITVGIAYLVGKVVNRFKEKLILEEAKVTGGDIGFLKFMGKVQRSNKV
ncbi:hypothetical protein KAS08_01005 [Candidatus Pacearchaeota archaeon]|nr:hypothetical protein [Candidatus Pacearchaeota archaeon]